MRGGVVGLGDEKLRLGARINGGEHVTDLEMIHLNSRDNIFDMEYF